MPGLVNCFSSPPVASIVQILVEELGVERRKATLAPSGDQRGPNPSRASFVCDPPDVPFVVIHEPRNGRLILLVAWYVMLRPSRETSGQSSRPVSEVILNSSPVSILAPQMSDSSLVLL